MRTNLRPRHFAPARRPARPGTLASALLAAALSCAPALPARAQTRQPSTTTTTPAAQRPATATPAAQPAKQAASAAPTPAPMPQRLVREGVAIELSVEPAGGGEGGPLLEGADAAVTFRVTDTTTGQPVTRLRPAAWIDGREPGAAPDAKTCRDKVQSFLQSRLRARPAIDLNTYYILALNDEPNISVIDPLVGLGTTKLLTLVLLKSPGADWALSADQRRLFVSMPLVNQVAVVDTATWRVTDNIDTAERPTRLRLQRDGKYLWVGTDGVEPSARTGVTVLDAASLKTVARVETGAGAHDLALSPDDRHAFVTNRADGTLSVIDAARLAKLRDVKTGPAPAAVAYSEAGRAAYVVDEADGSIVAVDPLRGAAARVAARPGLTSVRFAPDGRHGFAVNRKESAVHVFDAATNRLLHTVAVADSPDQVAFTKQFAYVRSLGSEQVTMIRLTEIGRPAIEQATVRFPAGQGLPRAAKSHSPAPALVNAPEDGSMLVANPADQMIYYYNEGMAAPMGNFRNYRRQPLALMVWDASLRETAPGVYRAQVKLTGQGAYDVALLLDSPRVVNCFDLTVAENPQLARRNRLPIKVEPLLDRRVLAVGQEARLRFKVTDAETGQPKLDLKDFGVLAFLAPGIWQQRDWARHVGEGVYETTFTPPRDGAYYVFVQCPSLGVQYRQIPHITLSAEKAATSKP